MCFLVVRGTQTSFAINIVMNELFLFQIENIYTTKHRKS